MKKNKLAIIITLLFSCFISSCIKLESKTNVDNKGTVFFYLGDESFSRTAMPAVDWTKYSFTIKAIADYDANSDDTSNEVVLKEKVAYSELGKGLSVDLKRYLFKITAYFGNVPAFSGAKEADLSKGKANVSFKMYPLDGATGNAQITINLPNDGVIAKVNVGLLTESDISTGTFKTTQSLPIDSNRKVDYSKLSLPSNTIQCAYFVFLDSQNTQIYSLLESMIIFGGATSYSNITVTPEDYHRSAVTLTAKKDGTVWVDCAKKISIVNKISNAVYELKCTNGIYTGSVPESSVDTFNVYIDGIDSGITFVPSDKTGDVNFYTVEFKSDSKGVVFSNVTGGDVSSGSCIVLSGKTVTFDVSIKEGYETYNFVVKRDGTTLATSVGSLTAVSVNGKTTISANGTKLKNYKIEYDSSYKEAEGQWVGGYNPPTSYTVEDTVILPSVANYKNKNGDILAGWKIQGLETETIIGNILPGTFHEDLILVPVTKDGAASDKTTIYANGISLLICEDNKKTRVYHDFNGNGIKDEDDTVVRGPNNEDDYDFSGYNLVAGSIYNKPIYSDFKFTMTGGTISSIKGNGALSENKSELWISGNAKIGGANSDLTGVTGVDLSTITNEWVTVNGQMTGDYKVTVITRYDYEGMTPHYIAYINDSKFASLSNFTCYKQVPGLQLYEKKIIAMKNINENNVEKTIIRLANPNPIALPDPNDSDDKIEGTVDGGFSVGHDRISAECSVFSVKVENGTMRVGSTTLKGGSSYLCQPTESTYETSLSLDKDYVYLQILSSTNEISPEDASKFLAEMKFVRKDKSFPVSLIVNLETVPYTEIADMGVKYFNGSFYIGYNESSGIAWHTAYNSAKEKIFNGLKGYLINITSDVENNYIFRQMGLGQCWTGGARLTAEKDNRVYDSDTVDESIFNPNGNDKTRGINKDTRFMWQSGPEAGIWYQDGTITKDKDGQGKYSPKLKNGYTNWDSGEPNDSAKGEKIGGSWYNPTYKYYSEQCMHFLTSGKWNDYKYNNMDVKGYIVEFTPYETYYGSQTANYQSIKMQQSYDESCDNVQ